MKNLIIISFLLLLGLCGFGQEEKHLIDIQQELCLSIDSNFSTYGMMKCTDIAIQEWNKEIDKYYKLLMNTLQTEEQEKLKASQNQWLLYLDKEIEFVNTMYYNMEGTMWRVTAAGEVSNLSRKRALELIGHYEILTFKEK